LPSFDNVTLRRVLLLFAGLALVPWLGAQEPAPPPPPAAQPPAVQQPAPVPATTPPAAGAESQDPAPPDPATPKPARRGIPIDDGLVHTHCARCHALDDKQHMTRISYVRKSPEGWSETLKRMIRLHGVIVSPNDAKQLVRSLSNSNGLARSEAERGLYESERRVHWSEDQQDQDFRRACAECHPLGRVLLQQRDDEEWQLLRATHVAMFPLARGQMGGGPPEEERRRGGPGEGGAGGPGGAPASGAPGGAPTGAPGATTEAGPGGGRRGGQGEAGPGQGVPALGVGDRVLQKLAKDQPLFTPAWEQWSRNRREVPLAGSWTVTGHETGRGDILGTAVITRTGPDEYDVAWQLSFADGSQLARTGKGLLYAGYSWRGRSAEAGAAAAQWREVLLLDDAWQALRGRLFTGTHDEIGADVKLVRDQQRPRVVALGNRAVPVPVTGHAIDVHGEGFPAVAASDLFVGAGVTITALQRVSDRLLRITVDVAAGAELTTRTVAFGSEPGSATLQLYDTVDYVRITPLQGLARIGGAKHPKQMERFEAFAVFRGVDGKPYTPDDVDLFQVRPRWALEEFRVRDNDDDLAYVGSLDAATGVFTPNVDGPNPARKWSANNVGDVFVTAEVELEVAVRPEPKKPDEKKAADKPADQPGEAPAAEPKPAPEAGKPEVPAGPPARVKKTFRARSHLIVTVPLYSRWMSLDWEDR